MGFSVHKCLFCGAVQWASSPPGFLTLKLNIVRPVFLKGIELRPGTEEAANRSAQLTAASYTLTDANPAPTDASCMLSHASSLTAGRYMATAANATRSTYPM
ncbi:hypothetical protein GN956_G2846 [Arapaima gigas]